MRPLWKILSICSASFPKRFWLKMEIIVLKRDVFLKRSHNKDSRRKTVTQTTLAWMHENGYNENELNIQGNYGNTALMKASREGKFEIVKELLDAGADIALKNADGNTALWLACFSENSSIVEILIDAGIEIDTLNINGVTPLMYAASSGKENMVTLLLNAGADVSIKNPDDFTALDLAASAKILKMLRLAQKNKTA